MAWQITFTTPGPETVVTGNLGYHGASSGGGKAICCEWKSLQVVPVAEVAAPLVLPTRPFQPAWLAWNLVDTYILVCAWRQKQLNSTSHVACPGWSAKGKRNHGRTDLGSRLPNWHLLQPCPLRSEVEAQKAAMAFRHHQESKTNAVEINADTINKEPDKSDMLQVCVACMGCG